MTTRDTRDQLLEFLDQHVFDPILSHRRDDFPGEAERRKFDDVKRSTESEKRRFRENYGSAEEVRDNYLADLSSKTGKKKSRELERLGLPALPHVREKFLGLCARLGVSS